MKRRMRMKKVMVVVILLVATVIVLSGCTPPILVDPFGNCRNRAVYCALEAAEHYEVAIVTGPTKAFPETIYHAQAKAKINSEWQWLYMMGENCYIGQQDQFTPLNEWNIENFIKYLASNWKK